jgi:hypothetical protein
VPGVVLGVDIDGNVHRYLIEALHFCMLAVR